MNICTTCKTQFESSKIGEDVNCFHCELVKVTGGSFPEAADLNTAALLSGTMTEREWRQIQEDMRSSYVSEESTDELYGEDEYDPYDDSDYDS